MEIQILYMCVPSLVNVMQNDKIFHQGILM
jgi:hypothetical protein